MARDYEARGLYQKAAQSYEEALSLREEEDVRRELLEVCALAYGEGSMSRSAYKKALETACGLCPEEAGYWVRLAELSRDGGNYKEARKVLDRADRAGARSEELSALNVEIRYAFTARSWYFSEFRAGPNGYMSLRDGDRWGAATPNGDVVYECAYPYVSPYSDDGDVLFCEEDSVRLMDGKGVVQAILEAPPAEARAYGDGLLPVFQDGKWRYLDCEEGNCLPAAYDDASSFQDGVAAVRQGDVWSLIDPAGVPVLEQTFTGVKLCGNGDYSYRGYFAAQANGAWALYDSKGKAASEFTAQDMDVYLGGAIAFQDASGAWGFVDRKGNVVVEPRFRQARSFSNGLAAVCDGERWGFLGEDGQMAIDFQFLDAGYFSPAGVCPVSEVDGQYHMIRLRFPGGN